MQRQVPAVLRVRHPPVSVRRQSVGHSCYASETGIRSATVQVAGSFYFCFLADAVVAALVVEIGRCMFRAGLLVIMQFSLFSLRLVKVQDLRHLGRYGQSMIFDIMVDMDQKVLFLELVPAFSSCLFDSGYKFAFVYVALVFQRHAWIDSGYIFASFCGVFVFRAILGSTVDTNLRQSTELFCLLCNTWFDSGYSLRQSTELFVFQRNAWFDSGYICRARRRVGSGMVPAGLLVTMISRCVHFVVGRPVESSQVLSLRQFQLFAASWEVG